MLNLLLEEIIRGIENVKGEEIQKMDLREIENTPCDFLLFVVEIQIPKSVAIVNSVQKTVSKALT